MSLDPRLPRTGHARAVAIPHVPAWMTAKPSLRGWSHFVAFIAAVALCPIAIIFAPNGAPTAAAAIFSGSVIGLFGVSAAFHRGSWGPRMHTVMQRLDHSMIFVAIAATYTPFAVTALPPGPGRLILWVVWIGASVGVAFRLAWPSAPSALVALAYLAVGWSCLLVIDDLWRSLSAAALVLLLTGGVLHTIGAVVYATKRPNPWPRVFGFHEVFHVFTIAAVACHYVAISVFALPMA